MDTIQEAMTTHEKRLVHDISLAIQVGAPLAVVQSRRKSDGKLVRVLCIATRTEGGVDLRPFAELIPEPAERLYDTPEGANLDMEVV